MMRKLIVTMVALFVLAVPAGAQLRKYKNWATTPEAYFLTAAEREEWSGVKTDAQAAALVERYHARRGNDFKQELTHRIQMTDKYLSIGKKKGSETTRGKLAIVFGPPTKLDRTSSSRSAGRSAAIPPIIGVEGEGSSPSGISLGDAVQAADSVSRIRATASSVVVEIMTWSEKGLPRPLSEPVIVRIEIDSAGREKVQGSKQELEKLDAMIESVAQASIRGES